jgi:hypothetical protein
MKIDNIYLMERLLKIIKRGSKRIIRKYRYEKKVCESLFGDMSRIAELRILPAALWLFAEIDILIGLSGCL